MKTKLVPTGKSYILRIPKRLIEKAGLKGKIDLVVGTEEIILRPRNSKPRKGWEKAILKAILEQGGAYTKEDIEWMNAPMGPPK